MSVLPNDPKFLSRYKKMQRHQCVQRLYRQLEILEKRINQGYKALTSDEPLPVDQSWLIRDTLTLDLESYYTVAQDLLKSIQILLPEADQKKLKRETTYKTICKLRNLATRHAYDKIDSDPFLGFSWNIKTGVSLKGGTPFGNELDPGHLENRKNLHDLLDSLLADFSSRWPRSLIAYWYTNMP